MYFTETRELNNLRSMGMELTTRLLADAKSNQQDIVYGKLKCDCMSRVSRAVVPFEFLKGREVLC